MSKSTVVKEFPLDGTEKGIISVGYIETPYGANSETVASIGISLNGNSGEPDWKVHLPVANVKEVCEALLEVVSKLK